MIGLIIAAWAKGSRMISVGYAGSGTSGRENFPQGREPEHVSGLYSLVRNPLYWGNMLIFAGLLTVFAHPGPWSCS